VNAVASKLLRYRDGRGDDWADIIDMLTLHRELRRKVSRLLAGIDAAAGGYTLTSTRPLAMHIDQFTFGSIRIDGVIYEHDVVIARGRVRKRKKKASRSFRDAFGHTPVSIEENIPWDCRRLVVGTGADGALPVMDAVKQEAARREVELMTVPTREAIRALQAEPKDTNAILHVTC
jgi:hypothetical protein